MLYKYYLLSIILAKDITYHLELFILPYVAAIGNLF